MKEINIGLKTDKSLSEVLSIIEDQVGAVHTISTHPVWEHRELPVETAIGRELTQVREELDAAQEEAKPVSKKKAVRKKAAAKKKAKKKIAKKSAAPEGADAETNGNGVDPEPPAKFKEHTADDVRGILRDVLKHEELGNNAAKELLAKYGAANVSQLEEAKYQAVIEDGQALIDVVTGGEE